MSEVKRIELANGHCIYVEMESAEIPHEPKSSKTRPSDLPEGAEPVSYKKDVVDAMQVLKDNIQGLAESVYDSLQESQPEEWSLEVNIGFKGKSSPIPIILSGEASGSIKVTATWKKSV